MIRFVGNRPDGMPQKRSQSLRACERCRKRKKRCMHTSSSEADQSVTNFTSPANTSTSMTSTQLSTAEPRIIDRSSSTADVTNVSSVTSITNLENVDDDNADDESDDEDSDRFIGDLNPESMFFAATSPQMTMSPGEDHVGIWIPRKALAGFRKSLSSSGASQSPGPDPLLANILLPYMQRQCQQLLPAAFHYASLYRIYLQEIHPIFPVIDLQTLDKSSSEQSPSTLLVKQAVCLAASTSPRAVRFLQLSSGNSEPPETDSGNSASQLASAIRTSVDMGFVTDPVVVVQVLTTLAFFTQFSHQSNLSAEITARAISHSQTIGLHLDVPSTRKNHEYLTRLFCCVWVLDKLNAAFQGRPTMLHEQDFGRDLTRTLTSQEGCFRLLLKIVSFLDAIIVLYRPAGGSSRNLLKEIPSFEDLIHECDAVRVSSSLLASVEILYHAVILLSCRPNSLNPSSSPLEIRETLSAANIVFIVGTEFREQISHMPFAPYALSLSLRIFYRELRFGSKSPFTRNRARKQLLSACQLLKESFSSNFPSAMKVAELAEQTVKEMEKVYNNILQQQSSTHSSSEVTDRDGHGRASGNMQPDAGESWRPLSDPDIMSFEPSTSEELPDLDVFEFFDSDFHLDAIDAALIDNMALTFPPTIDSLGFAKGGQLTH